MKTQSLLASTLTLSLVLGAAACGGESKPASAPESNAGITETSAKEDMPPPPSKDGTPAAAAAPNDAKPADGPGPAGGVIKLAGMKLTPVKKGKDKPVELKDDGSVLVDGKPAAKIKADSVDSAGGTSMLTVGVDGSLVGNGVKPGYKFEGDELVHENGLKLAVGDDGTINVTKDGKTEPLAKTDGSAATAKRAALIATVLWLTVPSGSAKPAGAGKDAKPTIAAPKKK